MTRLLGQDTACFGGLGLLVVVVSLAAIVPASHADTRNPPLAVKASIDDVAWIAGHWARQSDKDHLEESWSLPRGDCMMGVFRWLKDGKVWIYELLTIREEDQTLVLRFRHFGHDLTSWEPKNEPLTYRLVAISEKEAVFENPLSDSHRRYALSRPDLNTLAVRVGAFRDGEVSSTEFVYRRLVQRQP